jgi:hypothetical protein
MVETPFLVHEIQFFLCIEIQFLGNTITTMENPGIPPKSINKA